MAVFEAPQKQTMFTTAERVRLIQEAAAGLSNVEVRSFSGLVVDYAQAQGATAIVRGIRMHADFESEFEMALMNRKLAPGVDVVCLMTDGTLSVRARLAAQGSRHARRRHSGTCTGQRYRSARGALRTTEITG